MLSPCHCRLVLENSGIAEPANIRERFREAETAGHPLLKRIVLDTMVTVVDSQSFIADYSSRSPAMARPDLGEGGNLRPVVDLLVEQIECAHSLPRAQQPHLALTSGALTRCWRAQVC